MPKVENAPTKDTERLDHDQRKYTSPSAILLAVLIFFVAFFVIGGIFMSFRGGMMYGHRNSIIDHRGNRGSMRGYSHPMFAQQTTTSSTNNKTFTSGVVTSVDGSSFVIAGNGSQQSVKTTGDTTWNTIDKKVSTNDSVVVAGAKSGSTITATNVRIVNY